MEKSSSNSFNLKESLEDISGQLEMGKIDQATALEALSNIVNSFKESEDGGYTDYGKNI